MKPWKTLQEQLNTFKQRGATVDDDVTAQRYLQGIGYYRLSGYSYPFRKRGEKYTPYDPANPPTNRKEKNRVITPVEDDFLDGVTFKYFVDLYVFDKKLRLLAMDGLERIEIAMRSHIAYLLGEKSPTAYLEPNFFHTSFTIINTDTGLSKQHQWLGKQANLITRSGEDFVKHHKEKYGLPLPIWVACEVWDFGCMSTLFAGMHETEQDSISCLYGISNGRIFATWLRSLNYLRNLCAHHSRLWNRNIVNTPMLPSSLNMSWVTHFETDQHAKVRVFLLLCICSHLLKTICPNSEWQFRLVELLNSFPDIKSFSLDLYGMGAVQNWMSILEEIKNP